MSTAPIVAVRDRARCTKCFQPARGAVPADGEVPAHTCRCCAKHCHMARYIALGAAIAAADDQATPDAAARLG